MDIKITNEQENISILHLSGALDGQTYRELVTAAQGALTSGTKNILIDMSELTFISSAGLVALHVTALISRGEAMPNLDQGWTALKSVGTSREGGMQKHVKLLNPRKEIVDVLEMVGFSLFFEIFTDKDKAIQSFS